MTKTNNKAFMTLLNALHPFEVALLRERVVKMMEITRECVKEDPTAFDNPFVNSTAYLKLADQVDKHLGFN